MCFAMAESNRSGAASGTIWIQVPNAASRLNIKGWLSLKCWVVGHEDWIRRTPDRMYLKRFECGRETHGWTTSTRCRAGQIGSGAVQAAPISKRTDDSASALARSAMDGSPVSRRIAHDGGMTFAA